VTEHFPALAAQADDLAEALLAFHEEHMQGGGFALPDCARSAPSDMSWLDSTAARGDCDPLLFV